MDNLKDLVFTQKRTVSVRDVCHLLNVHVSEARRLLEDLVEQTKNVDPALDVTYVVAGYGKSSDDFKVQQLTFAKADELEEIKKDFESVVSCKINSVNLKDEETTNPELPIKVSMLSREEILKQQKLTYILNDEIQLRADRLARLNLNPGNQTNGHIEAESEKVKIKEEKNKETKTKEIKETKPNNKKTTTRNSKNSKKQTKLSGFGKKAPKVEQTNSSADSGISIESTPDPFTDEEEEEEKDSRETEEMEVEPRIASPSPPPSPKVKTESDNKLEQQIVDSEDEAIVLEKKEKKAKKESKKRKRVRVYDSDEEDEEALALKILAAEDENSNNARSSFESNKSEKIKSPKKKKAPLMETKTVSEEFTDEDGFTQVKLVKKLVPVEDNGKSEPKNSDDENKNVDKSKKNNSIRPVSKKQKTEEEDMEDESKPKAKKLTKAAQAKKGLVSITSFFKPASKN